MTSRNPSKVQWDEPAAPAAAGPWTEFQRPTAAPAAPAAEPAASGTDWSQFKPVEPPKKSSAVRRVLGDTAVDLGRGVVGAGEAVVGLANIPTFGAAGKGLEAIGYRPQQTKDMIGELYSPERKAAQQEVERAKGFVDTAKAMIRNPSTIAGTVAESVPSIAGGGAVARGLKVVRGLGTVARAAIGEGAVGAGQQAEGIRQQTSDGMLSAQQVGAAIGTGVGTGLIGAGGGAVARRLGVADVDVALAGGSTATGDARQNLLRRTLSGAARGAAAEGVLEELPQSMQEQAWENVALGRPVGEGVPEAGAMGLLTGTAMGGPVGAFSTARPRRTLLGGQPLPDPANGPMSRAVHVANESGALGPVAQAPQASGVGSGEFPPAVVQYGSAASTGVDPRPIDTRPLSRPWVDDESGFEGEPTDDEIRDSIRRHLNEVRAAGMRTSRGAIAEGLGLELKRVNPLIDDIAAERRRAAVTTVEAGADEPQSNDERAEPAGSNLPGAVDAGGRPIEPAAVPADAADPDRSGGSQTANTAAFGGRTPEDRTDPLPDAAGGTEPVTDAAGWDDALLADDEPAAARGTAVPMIALNEPREAQSETGIALDRAQRLTERFTKHWGPDAPKVVLARSADDLRRVAGLPEDTPVGDRAEGSWNGQPAVFLNIGAIDSPQRMRKVLAHEALGHYGVEQVVGPQEWVAIATAIDRHLRDGTGSSSVRSAIEQVRRSQPEALNDPQTAAREVLAVMAESDSPGGLFNRVIAGARRHLRTLMPDLIISTAELRDLLRQADGVLRGRATSRAGAPAGMVFEAPVERRAAYYSRAADPGAVPPPDVSKVAAEFPHLDDAQRAALGKIDTHRAREGIVAKTRRLTDNWRTKVVQGVFDQFAPLKDLDETAYMQARLSKGTDGAVEGVFRFGPPKLSEGALDVRRDGKGFAGVLQELDGEHDLFLAWVAGNRAERLASEGREHAFSPEDITSLKRLSRGTMPDGRDRGKAYADAQRALVRYNRAVLDVAEQAGLLNPESRKTWEAEWYVPFYRVMEGEGAVSPGAVGGIVRQRVIEKLKGGTEPLGDLLQNTLANWSHLLAASMKNMAASRALDAAVDLGVADRAKAGDKGTVWAMKDGQQVHFTVNDPLVFDALTMLHHPGWNNPAMKSMQWFKRVLTTGVTADPAFRIRNLMRDTVSVMAANPVGFNPLRNLVDGWRATEQGSDTYLKLLGGGGAVRFGSMLDGDQAANAKRLISDGIAREEQILDTPAKVKAALSRSWDWWKEVGDRAETVNRAAIYQQAIADGKTHLEASFAARDALDFTMSGKWAAVRFLTQTVPFMNARLQGLYKLGRGAKADPRRFATVTGAVAMASALLYLGNRDDEEFRALPDWVRDTYWWVRVPGTDHALFIPKPFEVGALGSVVERGTELMLAGDDYAARDFGHTLQSILSSQLSMNPVPQMFRPVTEAAFNWNSFQDRPIDGMGQERLPAADRYTARTSAGAIAAGRITGLSPQRIEHMVRGYFGWLGTQALAVSDMVGRGLTDMPANPAHDFTRPENLAVVGAFVRPTSAAGSKYVNRYYRDLDAVEQLYAAYAVARQAGDVGRVQELVADGRLRLRGIYTTVDRHMKAVNQRIRRVTADRTMSAGAKAEMLDGLHETRNRLARQAGELARSMER